MATISIVISALSLGDLDGAATEQTSRENEALDALWNGEDVVVVESKDGGKGLLAATNN